SKGGLGMVEVKEGVGAQVSEVIDLATTGTGARERVDAIAIRNWIQTHHPDHAVIERGQAMPEQGSSSGFKYGKAVGSLEAVGACYEIPMTIIEPAVWKRALTAKAPANSRCNGFRLHTFCWPTSVTISVPKPR